MAQVHHDRVLRAQTSFVGQPDIIHVVDLEHDVIEHLAAKIHRGRGKRMMPSRDGMEEQGLQFHSFDLIFYYVGELEAHLVQIEVSRLCMIP